jgi:hypothetical protein
MTKEVLEKTLLAFEGTNIKPTVHKTNGQHVQINWKVNGHPSRKFVVASTASDHRSYKNNAAAVRRMLKADGAFNEYAPKKPEEPKPSRAPQIPINPVTSLEHALALPVTLADVLAELRALRRDMASLNEAFASLRAVPDEAPAPIVFEAPTPEPEPTPEPAPVFIPLQKGSIVMRVYRALDFQKTTNVESLSLALHMEAAKVNGALFQLSRKKLAERVARNAWRRRALDESMTRPKLPRAGTVAARVYEALDAKNTKSAADLAAELDEPAHNVASTLTVLNQRKLAAKLGRGKWLRSNGQPHHDMVQPTAG